MIRLAAGALAGWLLCRWWWGEVIAAAEAPAVRCRSTYMERRCVKPRDHDGDHYNSDDPPCQWRNAPALRGSP